MIYTESLTSPGQDEDPLCQSVPVTGCQVAVFIPTQPSRVAVIHNQHPNKKVLSVFDVSIKKSKYKSDIQGRYRDARQRSALKYGKGNGLCDFTFFKSAHHSAAGGVLHPEHQLFRDPFRGEE